MAVGRLNSGIGAPRGQMSIEFFIIAGFILLASSVLISNSDTQIQEAVSLNNIVAGRNALDLEVSAAKYVYLQGNNSAITNYVFVPANTSCFNFNSSLNKFYCVTSGVTGLVFSDEVGFLVTTTTADVCTKSGWLRFTVRSRDDGVVYACVRVSN
ncbi:MAG: hypothetical protein V1787_00965 [Candidatus Micrarchaeota archaeon]